MQYPIALQDREREHGGFRVIRLDGQSNRKRINDVLHDLRGRKNRGAVVLIALHLPAKGRDDRLELVQNLTLLVRIEAVVQDAVRAFAATPFAHSRVAPGTGLPKERGVQGRLSASELLQLSIEIA